MGFVTFSGNKWLSLRTSLPAVSDTVEQLNLSFYMHDEAVAASSAPGDTAGRYLPYESADLYGDLQRRLRVKPAVII